MPNPAKANKHEEPKSQSAVEGNQPNLPRIPDLPSCHICECGNSAPEVYERAETDLHKLIHVYCHKTSLGMTEDFLLAAIDTLLVRTPDLLNQPNKKGETPLIFLLGLINGRGKCFAEGKKTTLAHHLLKKEKIDLKAMNNRKQNALHVAVMRYHHPGIDISVIKALLEKAPELLNSTDDQNRTPFFIGTKEHSPDLIQYLHHQEITQLKQAQDEKDPDPEPGAKVKQRDEEPKLEGAVDNNQRNLSPTLVLPHRRPCDADASPVRVYERAMTELHNLLHRYSFKDDLDMSDSFRAIDELLEKNPQLLNQPNEKGETPLIFLLGCTKGHSMRFITKQKKTQLVHHLLTKQGIDLYATDDFQQNALHMAAMHCSRSPGIELSVIKTLLEKAPRLLNSIDCDGNTPSLVAIVCDKSRNREFAVYLHQQVMNLTQVARKQAPEEKDLDTQPAINFLYQQEIQAAIKFLYKKECTASITQDRNGASLQLSFSRKEDADLVCGSLNSYFPIDAFFQVEESENNFCLKISIEQCKKLFGFAQRNFDEKCAALQELIKDDDISIDAKKHLEEFIEKITQKKQRNEFTITGIEALEKEPQNLGIPMSPELKIAMGAVIISIAMCSLLATGVLAVTSAMVIGTASTASAGGGHIAATLLSHFYGKRRIQEIFEKKPQHDESAAGNAPKKT